MRGKCGSVVLDTLGGKLGDDVVEVVVVWVAMSAVIADARLVVDLIPDDRVSLAGRYWRPDGESQTPAPCLRQQRQHLPTTDKTHILAAVTTRKKQCLPTTLERR